MIALLVPGLVVGETVGQHPVEDAEQLKPLLFGQIRPDRRPGWLVRSARGGMGSRWDRDMMRLLRGEWLVAGRTRGPVQARPSDPRLYAPLYPDAPLYSLRQRLPREGDSVGIFFVFSNRRRDRIKILYWDRDGYVIWMKRLERGSLCWPSPRDTRVELTAAELAAILGGIDLSTARRRLRYVRPIA